MAEINTDHSRNLAYSEKNHQNPVSENGYTAYVYVTVLCTVPSISQDLFKFSSAVTLPQSRKDLVIQLDKMIFGHSSEKRGLCLKKCSSEMLQNLPYFCNTKTHIVFCFILCYFTFPRNACPGLCQHRLGYSLRKKIE